MNPEDIKYKDKNTKIIYKGELVDYPFQTNIHQLEKEEFIDCLYDLFHKEEKEDYDSFWICSMGNLESQSLKSS